MTLRLVQSWSIVSYPQNPCFPSASRELCRLWKCTLVCSAHHHRTVGTNPGLYLGTIWNVCLICQPLDFCWTSSSPEVSQVPLCFNTAKVRNYKVRNRLGYIRHKSKGSRLPFSKDASHSSYSLYEKKKNNMGICNYKAQNSFFRRKNMIHTSKDAQATAAICSRGPNP